MRQNPKKVMTENEQISAVTQVEQDTKHDSSASTTSETKSSKDIENPKASLDNDEVSTDESDRVGRFATIMNLLNSLLGAGIFSLPGKFGNIGIIPSIILLAIASFISYVSTRILVRLQHDTKATGLDDLTLKILGRKGQIVISILTLIFSIAGVLAYVVIACDAIQQWLAVYDISITYWTRVLLTFIYSILPIGFSIPKSLKFLSYISSLTMIIMVFYVIVVIVRAPKIIPKMNFKDSSFSLSSLGTGIFSAMSIFFLNFTLPLTTLPIIEKYNKDLKKRYSALMITTIVCYIILVIPSALAYLMVFDESPALIFSYDKFQKDVLFNIVKSGCFIAVSCSYPIFVRPVLNSWSQFMFDENDSTVLPWKKRGLVHLIAHIIPISVAAFYPNIMQILDYTGASGCLIDVMVPGLLWYWYYRPRYNNWQFWGSWFLIILGIFLAISTIAVNIMNSISSH